jgi:hypothetical protein
MLRKADEECGAEGWRSDGPIVGEMKYYKESRRKETSYIH